MEGIVYKDLSYKIYGLLFKVHRELGYYRNEKQYGDYFEEFITKDDYYQVQRYLITLNFRLALIVNFRQRTLYPKRVLNKYFSIQ